MFTFVLTLLQANDRECIVSAAVKDRVHVSNRMARWQPGSWDKYRKAHSRLSGKEHRCDIGGERGFKLLNHICFLSRVGLGIHLHHAPHSLQHHACTKLRGLDGEQWKAAAQSIDEGGSEGTLRSSSAAQTDGCGLQLQVPWIRSDEV